MPSADAHGQRLKDRFQLERAPVVISRSLRKAEISVTELRSDDPVDFITPPLPIEDSYDVGIQLREFGEHKLWEEGKLAKPCDLRAGDATIYDLKRSFEVHIDRPFHSLHFYIPRRAFNVIADDANATRVTELKYAPGQGVPDETLFNLSGSMVAALARPEQANQLFVDHVTLAAAVHIAQLYGGMRAKHRVVQGGLAPWQERRAIDILSANLDGSVTLHEIAQECGLSVSHFSRAFRQTTGLAPHSWLLTRRVHVAKGLLENKAMTLSEVALASGFADQSHLTRVFTREVGTSPGVYRRCLET